MYDRTIPHRNMIKYSRTDIVDSFRSVGFKKPFSVDLARDVMNTYSHISMGEKAENAFNTPKNEYETNIQNFLSQLDFNSFSGNSPLEKAIAVIASLSDIDGGEGDESEGEPLPIFTDSDSTSKSISEMQEDIEAKRKAGEAAPHTFNSSGGMVELIDKLSNSQIKMLDKLSILDSNSGIKSQIVGKKREMTQMTEYSEISRMSNLSGLVMPTFNYKFATKQMIIRKDRQQQKQLLVLLIDVSGSMNRRNKKDWVRAILTNRYEAVIAGKAELYISTFLKDVSEDFIRIHDKKSVDYAINNSFLKFNGMNTNIENALKSTISMIKSKKLGKHTINHLANPQIVVMNDGEDEVDDEYTPEIITNAFILGTDNDEMKTIVENSGGIYTRFL